MKKVIAGLSIVSLLSACATGQNLQANVYRAGQVNQAQNAVTVRILAVMPARIEVDNRANQQAAKMVGAVLGGVLGVLAGHSPNARAAGAVGGAVGGAAVGSAVGETVLVDGVSITYTNGNRTLNSAQVGKLCEYKPGPAVVISTSPTETRVQPNSVCPNPQ